MSTEPSSAPRQPRRGRRWALWLLLIPFVAVLDPAVYAHENPQIAGIPFFVWYQFLWVILGAAVTGLVYWLRRRNR